MAQEINEKKGENQNEQTEKSSIGDLYPGLIRKIMFDRMTPPYEIEVTFDKTTTIIFPATIKDVDLG